MIEYRDTIDGLIPEQLRGFFVGWPTPPTAQTHLELLRDSSAVVLAWDDELAAVVGFITAISDGVLAASIPLLEVLPSHQRRGIGTQLLERMLARLGDLYMIDLQCDPELRPFYEAVGMKPAHGMSIRRYEQQSGRRRSTP